MGIKGKIAWNLMTEKVSQKILVSMYEYQFSKVVEKTSNPQEINAELKSLGEFVGERLLMDYAERFRQHAKEFSEFADTLKLAYKVNVGHEPSSTHYDPDTNSITISDEKCIFCQGVELPEEMKEVKFCNLVSGVFQSVIDLRGFKGEVDQVESQATGGKTCTWVLKQFKE